MRNILIIILTIKKAKINNRIILSRLRNIVTKNYRDKIRKELYEIEKKNKDSQKPKKKGFIVFLLN